LHRVVVVALYLCLVGFLQQLPRLLELVQTHPDALVAQRDASVKPAQLQAKTKQISSFKRLASQPWGRHRLSFATIRIRSLC